MAKANLSFDNMFGELNKRAGKQSGNSNKLPIVEQSQVEVLVQPPIPPAPKISASSAIEGVEKKQVLQGKLAKQEKTQKKEYNYGTKRTFPIPDELWDDALIVMQAKGLKQVEFIQGLIRDCVETNRETIIAVKKMRGER